MVIGSGAPEITAETPVQPQTMYRDSPRLRVTHVLLDVDGTLVDSDAAAQAARQAAASRCAALTHAEVSALDVVRLRQTVLNDPLWRGVAGSAIRRETVRRLLAEHEVADEDALRDVLASFIEARDCALTTFPDVRACLIELRARGITLIAASNGDVDLERVGLAKFITDTHYAHEVGVAKPDPRFFTLALSRFDIPSHAALAVGDRVDNDYDPARAAGLHSMVIDRAGAVVDPSVARITALTELPALVECL